MTASDCANDYVEQLAASVLADTGHRPGVDPVMLLANQLGLWVSYEGDVGLHSRRVVFDEHVAAELRDIQIARGCAEHVLREDARPIDEDSISALARRLHVDARLVTGVVPVRRAARKKAV